MSRIGQSAAKSITKNLVIYRITNLVNGKCYIGQTMQGLARRKGEHRHRFKTGERDHKLYLAMRKHGVSNFKFEILCIALRPEYLDELEAHFIREHNSFNRGYNMTSGGDSVSLETRQKLSAVLTGRDVPWTKVYGAAHAKSRRYLIECPDGSRVVAHGLRQFCRDHGLSEGSLSCLGAACRGYVVIEKFNDHRDSEYGQAAGNGADPVLLQDQDMICSSIRKARQLSFSW